MQTKFIRAFIIGTIAFVIRGISNGANEPIADNQLGLTTKDCALQYCESLDALALWMTFIPECKTNSPVLVTHGSHSTSDPIARHDAKSCALYLCPSLHEEATAFLQTGCKTSFRNFLKSSS
jgi:hypothetical protein